MPADVSDIKEAAELYRKAREELEEARYRLYSLIRLSRLRDPQPTRGQLSRAVGLSPARIDQILYSEV